MTLFRRANALPAASLLMSAAPTAAHVAPDEHDAGLTFMSAVDPLGLLLIALLGGVYLRGQLRLRRQSSGSPQRTRGALTFWSGWIFLAAALTPPLDSLTGVSFAAHMVQHEILMLIAAPLLVLARPQGVLIWGLPGNFARGAAGMTGSRLVRRIAGHLSTPLPAWVLHALVLWGWHIPAAFQSTLVSEPLHWLQHSSFFLVALFFWYSVLAPGARSERTGAAFLSVFTTAVHTSVLGALLTFSSALWYPAYGGYAGLTALEDQQLGGLIMWVPGGAVFLIAAITMAARWMSALEERTSGG
jgi:putative membrane protein